MDISKESVDNGCSGVVPESLLSKRRSLSLSPSRECVNGNTSFQTPLKFKDTIEPILKLEFGDITSKSCLHSNFKRRSLSVSPPRACARNSIGFHSPPPNFKYTLKQLNNSNREDIVSKDNMGLKISICLKRNRSESPEVGCCKKTKNMVDEDAYFYYRRGRSESPTVECALPVKNQSHLSKVKETKYDGEKQVELKVCANNNSSSLLETNNIPTISEGDEDAISLFDENTWLKSSEDSLSVDLTHEEIEDLLKDKSDNELEGNYVVVDQTGYDEDKVGVDKLFGSKEKESIYSFLNNNQTFDLCSGDFEEIKPLDANHEFYISFEAKPTLNTTQVSGNSQVADQYAKIYNSNDKDETQENKFSVNTLLKNKLPNCTVTLSTLNDQTTRTVSLDPPPSVPIKTLPESSYNSKFFKIHKKPSEDISKNELKPYQLPENFIRPTLPEFEYISTDPKENEDNFDPQWDVLKVLTRDEDRMKTIIKRWRNLTIPKPNMNLSYRHTKPTHNFRTPSVAPKPVLNMRASRQRTRSERTNVDILESAKRQRSKSCTVLYEAIITAEKEQAAKTEQMLRQMNDEELHRVSQLQNLERFQNAHSYTYFNTRNLLYVRQLEELKNMKRSQEDKLYEVQKRNQGIIENYEALLAEVKTFNKFYNDIDGTDDDTLQLTEDEFELMSETERAFSEYQNIYLQN